MSNQMFLHILLAASYIICSGFASPSKRHLETVSLEDIKYNLYGRKGNLELRPLLDKAIENERIGFIGYHGNSLERMIYQDIIRIIVEDVIGMGKIREDFHFLDIPIDASRDAVQLEELWHPETKVSYSLFTMKTVTFPFQIALYDNTNRTGHNAILGLSSYSNTEIRHLHKRLSKLFEDLGLEKEKIPLLFETAKKTLIGNTQSRCGVLIQAFDTSNTPYSFVDKNAYLAFSTAFPSHKTRPSELLLSDSEKTFPPEIRFILSSAHTLNPHNSLSFKRYTKIQPSNQKAYVEEIRNNIRAISCDGDKVSKYKQQLELAWSNVEE